jgi:adenylate cyclase
MRNEELLSQPVKLFAEAELQAERTVALLRVAIAIVLGLVFVFAVLRASPAGEPILIRQWLFAGGTMLGYLLLGMASYIAIAKGVYRPWMAWLVVTGDSAFLLINIWLGLLNTGLPANYLTSMPPIWLAPVVLAFGALRFNPLLQAYLIVVLVAGLLAIAVSTGDWV